MKKTAFACALFALVACGGGSTAEHEKAMDESLSFQEQMVKILDGVTDKASGEKAVKEIKALVATAKESVKKYGELPELSEAQQKELLAKYQARRDAVVAEMKALYMKVAQNPDLVPVFEEMNKAMESMGQ